MSTKRKILLSVFFFLLFLYMAVTGVGIYYLVVMFIPPKLYEDLMYFTLYHIIWLIATLVFSGGFVPFFLMARRNQDLGFGKALRIGLYVYLAGPAGLLLSYIATRIYYR